MDTHVCNMSTPSEFGRRNLLNERMRVMTHNYREAALQLQDIYNSDRSVSADSKQVDILCL